MPSKIIDSLFSSHTVTPEGSAKIQETREAFTELKAKLDSMLGGDPHRYTAIRNTHLEEACHAAIKDIVLRNIV